MLALVEDNWLGTVLGKRVYTVGRDVENLDVNETISMVDKMSKTSCL